jgi:vancomycin resistance protein YoaR
MLIKRRILLIVAGLIAILLILCACASEASASGEHKISASIKFRAALSGGYAGLYDKLTADGMESADALNYISKGLGDETLKLATARDIKAEDATVEFTGEFDCPFLYTEEKSGRGVDKNKLCRDTALYLDGGREPECSYIELSPAISLEDIKAITAERSEFFTSYTTSSEGRKNNIALAAKYLSGTVIESGGEFSFNETVGPRTAARGFQKANIIFNGELVLGTGGGVCQVSSTLYNAFILSGLEVTGASRHSKVIPYLPASRDAMVSSTQDLTARNPYVNPVYITARADGNRLTIRIYGETPDSEYRLNSKIIKSIPAPEPLIKVEGMNIPEDIRTRLMKGSPSELCGIPYVEKKVKEAEAGLISEAYRERYVNGALMESTLISHDVYPATRAEILRVYIG